MRIKLIDNYMANKMQENKMNRIIKVDMRNIRIYKFNSNKSLDRIH